MPTERDFIPCHMCGMKNDALSCELWRKLHDYDKIETKEYGTGCCKKLEE